MAEEDNDYEYAFHPVDLSKLNSDQRKMMELNIRHMKRLMAPLKVNVKGDVQKRLNQLFDETNPIEERVITDKKKAPELSIKEKIKEITKISSSQNFGKTLAIRRSKKLEDPSKPIMRLDVLAMSKNYLEQMGYQDNALEFDLVKRQEHRKKTLKMMVEKKKMEQKRSPKRIRDLEKSIKEELSSHPMTMNSPKNFEQDVLTFKLTLDSLKKEVTDMMIKGSPRRKWTRQITNTDGPSFLTPRNPVTSSRNHNFGQTSNSLAPLPPLDPLRSSSHAKLTEKMKMGASHTSEYSIGQSKKGTTLYTPTSQMSTSLRQHGPMAPLALTQSKMNMSGIDSNFMLSPKSPTAIQEDAREYALPQQISMQNKRSTSIKHERSTSMSRISPNNRSRSKDFTPSRDILELNPEVEELFKDFNSALKKKIKKKKQALKSIQELENNEMNQNIKQAIKHYYSPEKPDTKKEVSQRADSIVEKYGYQTYDNSDIIQGIVSSNKYKGKTWEQIQYMNRIEKTEMYLKMIRAKKTKVVTVE